MVTMKIKQANEKVIYIKLKDTYHNDHNILGISIIILNLLND